MPNGDASGGRNWRAVPPDPRLRRSISPVFRGAREPTEPSAAVVWDRSPANKASTFIKKLVRERGSIKRCETRHGATPFARGDRLSGRTLRE